MKNDVSLALRINELYHDLENKKYSEKHNDIFIGEISRWQDICDKYFGPHKKSMKVMDVGSGTGFVASQILDCLNANDKFIFADISKKMLEVCRTDFLVNKTKPELQFLKLDGYNIDAPDKSCDIITMNSVLHHIPDLRLFFNEIKRIIKVNGLLIIAHEPNKLFFENLFLRFNYILMDNIIFFKKGLKKIFEFLGIWKFVYYYYKNKNSSGNYANIYNRINEILLEERIIDTPLLIYEIDKYLDFHSPTAGNSIDLSKGIDVNNIRKLYLKEFDCINFKTYNHLAKIDEYFVNNCLVNLYSKILNFFFPACGAHFLAILKNKGE